jgi:carbonic anhydrase
MRSLSILAVAVMMMACSTDQSPGVSTPAEPTTLTATVRDAMTPDQVLEAFKQGNQRFLNGQLRERKFLTEVEETSAGQFPKALVLSCIDSRIPAETIFDMRIGDMFSTRLAGNVLNADALGGMEFATAAAGAKLIVVMGHTKCGAVKGACSPTAFKDNLNTLVSGIRPVADRVRAGYAGATDGSDYAFVDDVAEENVRDIVARIPEQSPTLKSLIDSGSLKVVGAMYDVSTGAVEFLQ